MNDILNQNTSQPKVVVQDNLTNSSLPVLYPNTAGIDIGSKSNFVAVPADRDSPCVREFSSFTSGLHQMALWLKDCKITHIIMESTGSYWIPVYEVLESYGFKLSLVNARHVKNVSAHKTDVLDCQWIQQLGTYGLLKAAFRPKDDIIELRAYLRHRDNLIKEAAEKIQHMQKALTQMNLLLHNAISDISGKTGLAIIRKIVAGCKDPKELAKHRDERCLNSEEVIEQSLIGNYKKEHVFSLKQALELYDFYTIKINECDAQIASKMAALESKCDQAKIKRLTKKTQRSGEVAKKLKKHEYAFDLREELIRITGVDLTLIPSIGVSTAVTLISEIGTDMSSWRSAKQFASWLGLCPKNNVTGGKQRRGKTKRCANRVAIVLRMAANTLYRSNCAFGACLRRMKARLGPAKAITALAHKLAKLIYMMLKYGVEYVEKGVEYYEEKYKRRREKALRKTAKELGYELKPINA